MCANTGYKGRIGVYEMMEINTEMKDTIAKMLPLPKSNIWQ